MTRFNKTFSVLAVSFLLSLSSCDPNGSTNTSQNEDSSGLVYESLSASGFWSFNLDSCESDYLCIFDVYFKVFPYDFYSIYSSSSFDVDGSLYYLYDDIWYLIISDNDSGTLKNFKFATTLDTYKTYRLKITVTDYYEPSSRKSVSVYLEKYI